MKPTLKFPLCASIWPSVVLGLTVSWLALPVQCQPVNTGTCSPAASTPAASVSGWDNTGNSMLNGTYYFRYVQYTIGDQQGDFSYAATLYQNISFDGKGSYTIKGEFLDSIAGCSPQPITIAGAYAISAGGFGFLTNPVSPGDVIWGLVAKDGAFIGSTTETQKTFNDLFIAALLSSPEPTDATLSGSYSVGYLNFPDGFAADTVAAGFQMSPNGAGSIGAVNISAYQGDNAASDLTEAASYSFTNGAGVLSFPSYGPAIAGQEYLYISPDGEFIFGGAPDAFDIFVGVRTAPLGAAQPGQPGTGFGAEKFSGLYYQVGIDQIMSSVGGSLQTYYGALDAVGGIILDHQRIVAPLRAPVQPFGYPYQPVSYTYVDSYDVAFASSGGYTDTATGKQYSIGVNGTARMGFGVTPSLGITIALQAPPYVPPASGVSINPGGVVNAASYAPFTAGISPGELILIFGANFAAAPSLPVAAPFPSTLENVQVLINGSAVPIEYVTPQAIAAIVPSTLPPSKSSGTYAAIQVSNNGAMSNVVTAFVNETTPGILTQSENGIGDSLAFQSGSLGAPLVTPAKPAMAGEIVAVYATGLGLVNTPFGFFSSPPGPYLTVNNITATIGGLPAPVSFPNISPLASGVNEIDIQIPTGVAGDVPLVISGPDSQAAQATISVIAKSAASTTASSTVHAPSTSVRDRGALRNPFE